MRSNRQSKLAWTKSAWKGTWATGWICLASLCLITLLPSFQLWMTPASNGGSDFKSMLQFKLLVDKATSDCRSCLTKPAWWLERQSRRKQRASINVYEFFEGHIMQKGRDRKRGKKQFQDVQLGRKRHKGTHRWNVKMQFYLATKPKELPPQSDGGICVAIVIYN